MAGVDWERIYENYTALLPKISTRAELSDLIWELNGELGTSHCYEMGGDYDYPEPVITGKLCADYRFDSEANKWFFKHIVRGDSWSPEYDSPLNQPGLNIKPGDYLTAVNGRELSREFPPGKALAGCAGVRVLLTVEDRDGNRRDLTVNPISDETSARLREWINAKTGYVHEKTRGKVGYIYVQDMGPHGYAQFHRSFLAESRYEALIVDVRNNGGGHVSSLLLEKLMRKRYAYDLPRYGGWNPLAPDSIVGPVTALCDEYSGSDGDIFSHAFKMLKLGTLIGRRTWGGVVGINPSHALVDGTVTTQPEFFIWFGDKGWGIENYGAEPDIEVDYRPQDYAAGADPQLDRAIEEIMKQIAEKPPVIPEFGTPPDRKAPPLPPRG